MTHGRDQREYLSILLLNVFVFNDLTNSGGLSVDDSELLPILAFKGFNQKKFYERAAVMDVSRFLGFIMNRT